MAMEGVTSDAARRVPSVCPHLRGNSGESRAEWHIATLTPLYWGYLRREGTFQADSAGSIPVTRSSPKALDQPQALGFHPLSHTASSRSCP
jgi:hypothetical protein